MSVYLYVCVHVSVCVSVSVSIWTRVSMCLCVCPCVSPRVCVCVCTSGLCLFAKVKPLRHWSVVVGLIGHSEIQHARCSFVFSYRVCDSQ